MGVEKIIKNFDEIKRYVRVRCEDDRRFVKFDFAIGYPELFVELMLPIEAFQEFCEKNKVIHMDETMIREIDKDLIKWRYGENGRI